MAELRFAGSGESALAGGAPGIFTVTDGYMTTADIGGPGLGIPTRWCRAALKGSAMTDPAGGSPEGLRSD